MEKPALNYDTECSLCKAEAISLTLDGISIITWCKHGHVIIKDEPEPVYKFKEN